MVTISIQNLLSISRMTIDLRPGSNVIIRTVRGYELAFLKILDFLSSFYKMVHEAKKDDFKYLVRNYLGLDPVRDKSLQEGVIQITDNSARPGLYFDEVNTFTITIQSDGTVSFPDIDTDKNRGVEFLRNIYIQKNQSKFGDRKTLKDIIKKKLSPSSYKNLQEGIGRLFGYMAVNELVYMGLVSPGEEEAREQPIKPSKSGGFFKSLSLLTLFYRFLEKDRGLLVVDAPECSLHPMVIRHLLSMFDTELEEKSSHYVLFFTLSTSALNYFGSEETTRNSIYGVNKDRTLYQVTDKYRDELGHCQMGELFEQGCFD